MTELLVVIVAAALAIKAGVSATDDPEDLSGLVVAIGILGAVVAGVPLALVAVPLLILRRQQNGARIALIVTESVLLVLAAACLWLQRGGNFDGIQVALVAWIVAAIVTIAALLRRSAAAWATRSQQ